MVNFYEVLGVPQDAGESDIKKAYRSLSLKYHPDRNGDAEATEKYKLINEAYEVLSDQGKKNQHDMELKFGNGGGGGFPGFNMGMGGMPFAHMDTMNEFSDINNIFNMMFGGQGMGGMGGMPNVRIFHNGVPMNMGIQRPEPIQKTVELTLEQSYNGCNIPVDIERLNIINNVRSTEIETLYINVPQGIDNGETMLLHDRGHNINNQVRGEVRLHIKINNTTEFQRNGLDLIFNKKISLKEALCGFNFEINHVNGKRLCLNNVNNPTIVKPNFKKVVQGMGMIRENNKGNMIIEFDVEFPESLTKEQIESLQNIL
jgi:DnaJ-class molecular chaperone